MYASACVKNGSEVRIATICLRPFRPSNFELPGPAVRERQMVSKIGLPEGTLSTSRGTEVSEVSQYHNIVPRGSS